MGFPGGPVVKNLPANAGDVGSVPGSGRSPGEENGNPLQYSCLGNPMDRGAWQTTVHGIAKESDMTLRLNNYNYVLTMCFLFFLFMMSFNPENFLILEKLFFSFAIWAFKNPVTVSFIYLYLVIWSDIWCNKMLISINDWTDPFHWILNNLHSKVTSTHPHEISCHYYFMVVFFFFLVVRYTHQESWRLCVERFFFYLYTVFIGLLV